MDRHDLKMTKGRGRALLVRINATKEEIAWLNKVNVTYGSAQFATPSDAILFKRRWEEVVRRLNPRAWRDR